jgi:hypothetical protein
VVDCEGFEPSLAVSSGTLLKLFANEGGSSFYFPKDIFDYIPIHMTNHLKWVVVFSGNWSQIVCVIDEKFNRVKLITPV